MRSSTEFREIFAQKAFDPYRGVELSPGPAVKSDAEIDAHIRARGESAYHPSGSCKMGIDSDPMAVVDGEGRVHGLDASVVDASRMPHQSQCRGNRRSRIRDGRSCLATL